MIHEQFLRIFSVIFTLAVCATLVNGAEVSSESSVSREYQIKAAFMYKFTKFIDWTPESFIDMHDPFVLTIIGRDPFGKAIDSLQGKTVKGRKLVIRRIADMGDVDSSHILFISRSEKKKLTDILNAAGGSCLLTVSDMEGFTDNGGMIMFYTQDNSMRFEINKGIAHQAGLKISSKLLNVSKLTNDKSKDVNN